MSFKAFVACITVGLSLTAGLALAQSDPLGKVDTVSLYVETIADGKWMVSVHLWNDEPLAAIDIPLKYTAGVARIVIDSVAFKGTRLDGFEQRGAQIDTVKQVMHFGGFAYIASQKPPLPAGKGEVARIYFSARGEKKPGPFAVDTTAYSVSSTLMLADVNAKTIVPALKIEYKKAAAPATKKE
jgi:hypothetical protein